MGTHQSASKILMVKPALFFCNPDTIADNAFQNNDSQDVTAINHAALDEFNELHNALTTHGVEVVLFEDTKENETPDSIFPNNWFSSHPEGIHCLYPMMARTRRKERRPDILKYLKNEYPIVIDFTALENKEVFLEGTGSLVLDHQHRLAYCCESLRSHLESLLQWSTLLGFTAVPFKCVDPENKPIYHTNVIMSVGTQYVVLCSEAISTEVEALKIQSIIKETSKTIIDISWEQVLSFCGNIIELRSTTNETLIVMSEQARKAFTSEQINTLRKYGTIVATPIPTIERVGGGGVRCMIAELF